MLQVHALTFLRLHLYTASTRTHTPKAHNAHTQRTRSEHAYKTQMHTHTCTRARTHIHILYAPARVGNAGFDCTQYMLTVPLHEIEAYEQRMRKEQHRANGGRNADSSNKNDGERIGVSAVGPPTLWRTILDRC
jgi:hypothetical protein